MVIRGHGEQKERFSVMDTCKRKTTGGGRIRTSLSFEMELPEPSTNRGRSGVL